MSEHEESPSTDYPLGRGYGHDYMRGGEVFGGYGYSEREEYELRRGELSGIHEDASSAQSNPTPGTEAESVGGDSGGREGDAP